MHLFSSSRIIAHCFDWLIQNLIPSQIPMVYLPSFAPEEYVPKLVRSLSVGSTGVEEASEKELLFATVAARKMRGKLLMQQLVLKTGN